MVVAGEARRGRRVFSVARLGAVPAESSLVRTCLAGLAPPEADYAKAMQAGEV